VGKGTLVDLISHLLLTNGASATKAISDIAIAKSLDGRAVGLDGEGYGGRKSTYCGHILPQFNTAAASDEVSKFLG
jgi:hypothetical protein